MKIGFAYSAGDSPTNGVGPWSALASEVLDLRYNQPDACDLIILWGGTDINPAIYKEEPHPFNGYNPSSLRDEQEQFYIRRAIHLNIPLVGVCRGAQLLCAMAGGKLVQHVNGHGSSHNITTADGKVYQSSSSHHQMMWPWNLPQEEYQLLAWTEKRSTKYEGFHGRMDESTTCDPEVALFPKIRALAIQGHPEWQQHDEPFVQWCLELTKDLIGVEA